MKIVVAGCGYVGSALARTLASDGHEVIGTTTRAERAGEIEQLGVRSAVLRLADESLLRNTLSGADAVVVMVAPARDDAGHREVYLQGMHHLLQVLPQTRVRHVLYTSSTSVYGQCDGSWVDEDSSTEPLTENGRILLETEKILMESHTRERVATTVLRLAGIIGPGRGPARRVPAFSGRPREDGEGYVNLIHSEDIVRVCVRLIEQPWSGLLVLSDGRPIRRREFYDRLLHAMRLPPIQWVTAGAPTDLGKRINNRRACDLLGLEFRDAAAAAIEYARSPRSPDNGKTS